MPSGRVPKTSAAYARLTLTGPARKARMISYRKSSDLTPAFLFGFRPVVIVAEMLLSGAVDWERVSL